MLEDIDIIAADILLSGGADGADTEFGKAATKAKHTVVHWSFDEHKTKLKKNVYDLDQEKLLTADPFIIRANASLKRKFPASSEYTNNLLRRNYFQAKWCERLYAVSKFGGAETLLNVDGGTAWAIQMYADRFLYDRELFDNCELYMFDQTSSKWFKWKRIWQYIEKPPVPYGVYAGIGSRDLTSAGLAAIKSLYSKDAEA